MTQPKATPVVRPVKPATTRTSKASVAARRAEARSKVVGYLRVSTDEQAASGLGLDAQRAAIESTCSAKGWAVVEWCVDEGVSGKLSPSARPAMSRALALLDGYEAGGLVVAKLDRCSRNTHDFTGLLEQAERRGWGFVALDLGVDTSTPAGRLVAEMMVSVAQWERSVIAQRTKDALASKKARGDRLGRRSVLQADLLDRISSARVAGHSLRAIANELNAERIDNPTGSLSGWSAATVSRALKTARLNAEADARATA